MPHTPKLEHTPTIRIDETTFHRVEALRVALSNDWRSATFSEALRACVLRGLQAAERDPACLQVLKRRSEPSSS